MEVIDVDSRSDGDSCSVGETYIYVSSDEDNAVHADDAASVAVTSSVVAVSSDYHGNPSGASDTNIEGAGDSNGDDDAGGYSDGDDNHTGDHNNNVSSAVASKSQRAPYNYWPKRDICRLIKLDGRLSDGLDDVIVPSSVLYKRFMKNYQPIYRGNLTSRIISGKRYKLKKNFLEYCKSEASLHPGQEDPVYACCRKAWPHIVKKARADAANE